MRTGRRFSLSCPLFVLDVDLDVGLDLDLDLDLDGDGDGNNDAQPLRLSPTSLS